MTATTARPLVLPAARDVLDDLLDLPGLELLSVEARGHFLDQGCSIPRSRHGVDLDIQTATADDAAILADLWGLTANRPDIRPSTTGTHVGEYVHRSWTGTVRTTTGPLSIRVRTCRFLPPPVATLPSSPTH